MELSVVIIEDEKHSLETLSRLLLDFCQDVKLLGSASNVEDAISLINKTKPDLVFLDIELHSGTGFDILQKLDSISFEVIFTTAYEQYAVRAIKFSSVDYLLKPIDLDELLEALSKVRNRKGDKAYLLQIKNLVKNLEIQDVNNKKICLSTHEGMEFVRVLDILYCKANGSYTLFTLKNQKDQLVSKNLKEFEILLQEYDFMRVHNSYLINLREVKKYIKSDGGYIIMNNGDHVNLSQTKKDSFLERIVNLR